MWDLILFPRYVPPRFLILSIDQGRGCSVWGIWHTTWLLEMFEIGLFCLVENLSWDSQLVVSAHYLGIDFSKKNINNKDDSLYD